MRSQLRLLAYAIAAVVALTVPVQPGYCQDEDAEYPVTGPAPNHVFDVRGFDSIDLLNGNLHFEQVLYSAQVNSGFHYELKLVYNSTVWKWHPSEDPNQDAMRLSSKSPVGLGFRLHMGRVYSLARPSAPDHWFYEDPSGASHRLKEDNEGGVTYYWSQDSTFLRAKKDVDPNDASTYWQLWLPDGTKLTLRHRVTLGSDFLPNIQGWYTTLIESPVMGSANQVTVAYDTGNKEACIRTITDSFNRVVTFSNADTLLGHTISGGYTQSVEVPVFGDPNAKALYMFEYTIDNVHRPTPSTPFVEPNELLLTKVVLPESGFDLSFSYDDPPMGRVEGPITSVVLGLGGGPPPVTARIRYEYNKFTPNNDRTGDFQQEVEHRYLDSAEGQTYEWRYDRSAYRLACRHVYRVRTDLLDPYGNTTRYEFTGQPSEPPDSGCTCPNPITGDPMPCTELRPNGLLLSAEHYRGSLDTGDLLLEGRRFYDMDLDFNPPLPRFGASVRLARAESVFHDAGGKTSNVEFAGWDGFHYKERKEYDFDGNLYRVYRTEYVVPASDQPKWANWVMNTYTSTGVYSPWCSDPNNPLGLPPGEPECPTPVSISEFDFREDGFLESRRDFVTPTYPPTYTDAGDILTIYTPDPNNTGNVTQVSVQHPSTPLPATDTVYGYEWGYLANVRTAGLGWNSFDRTVDKNTGLTYVSKDPALVETTFDYDSLGRLKEVTPTAPERPTVYTYPSALESVTERSDPNSGEVIRERQLFDSLGRVIEERRRDATGSEVRRISRYDGPDPRVTFQSEWAPVSDPNPDGIAYSYDYPPAGGGGVGASGKDPFGRVQRVTLPDDPNLHFTIYTYAGGDSTESVHGINNDPAQVATTAYEADAFGRLAQVTPPPLGAIAKYEYDRLDHVTAINMHDQVPNSPRTVAGVTVFSPGTQIQTRTRTYDALLRMIEKVEPETGRTTYDAFDPRGNLLQQTQYDDRDPNHPERSILRQTYDSASRPLTATLQPDPDVATQYLITERAYDDPNSANSAGKLTSISSFDDAEVFVVQQKNQYEGLNGRLSKLTTTFPGWSGGNPRDLIVEIASGNFGRESTITYPQADPNANPNLMTKATKHFLSGWLSSVRVTHDPGDANAVTVATLAWDPAGAVETITAGNGIQTAYSSGILNRPSRVVVTNSPQTLLDTGSFVYDGAQNITDLGLDHFSYDLRGQLVAANVSANGSRPPYTLSYTYDSLGNIVHSLNPGSWMNEVLSPARAATNRLISVNGSNVEASYDENGNLGFDGSLTYVWDKRSRLKMVGAPGEPAGEYRYDSSDLRVYRKDNLVRRDTHQVRDPGGRLLSEYSKPIDSTREPQWTRDYVYAAGRLVAIVQNSQPMEPAGIVSSASASTVHLQWQAGTDLDLYGYNVYRSLSSTSGFQRVNAGTILGTSFDDASPYSDPNGQGIPTYYVVAASDWAGIESPHSSPRLITAGDTTAPATPQDVVVESTLMIIELSWSSNQEVDLAGYYVYRSISSGGSQTQLNSIPLSVTSFTDIAPEAGVTYYYKIRAVDTAGNLSPASTEASGASEGPGGGGGPCEPNCFPQGLLHDCLYEPFGLACVSPWRFIGSPPGPDPGWEILYVHTDHLGSTRVVTNSAGEVVSHQNYFPFGEEMPPFSEVATSKSFTGHERDDESGSLYMGARHYNPSLSRFTSPDPVTDSIPSSMNRYIYVENSPIDTIDPTGKFSLSFLSYLLSFEGFDHGDSGFLGGFTYSWTSYRKPLDLFSRDVFHGPGDQEDGAEITDDDGMMGLGGNAYFIGPATRVAAKWIARNSGKIVRGIKAGWSKFKGLFSRSKPVGKPGLQFSTKIERQMASRGWTRQMIDEAMALGRRFRHYNLKNGNPATRYVHPDTGKSVIVDDVTGEVLQVADVGYKWNASSGAIDIE